MIRSVVTTYATRFAAILTTLLLLPIVVSHVGTASYGLYTSTVSLSVLFSIDLGMGASSTRYAAAYAAANDTQGLRTITAVTSLFFLAVGFVMSAIFAVCLVIVLGKTHIPPDLTDEARELAILAVANLAVSMALASHRQILAGVGRIDIANYTQIAQSVIRVVATVLALQLGLGIVTVGLIDLVAAGTCGGAAWILRRKFCPSTIATPADATSSELRKVAKLGASVMIMNVAGLAIMQGGPVIAGLAMSLTAATIYTVANRAYLLAREVTNSLTTALLPHASARSAHSSAHSLRDLYLQGTAATNMLVILVVVPLSVFMYPILQLWVGPELAVAAIPAQILVASMLINNNHLVAIPILTAYEKLRPYALLHLIWATTGIISAYVLGREFGAIGVAAGLVLPMILLEPLYVLIAVRLTGAKISDFARQCLFRPIAISIVPSLALFAIGAKVERSIILVILTTVVWVVLMLLLLYKFGASKQMKLSIKSRVAGRIQWRRTRFQRALAQRGER